MFMLRPSFGIIPFWLRDIISFDFVKDASLADGATFLKAIRYISPTTFFLIVMNLIYSLLDIFGLIDAAIEGGPEGERQKS